MNDKDLDELERQYASDDLHDCADMHCTLIVRAPSLIRLARRGLRAEREVCAACEHWGDDYCDWWDYRRYATGHCSDWRERGGAL